MEQMDLKGRNNEPHITHIDDEYFYELWVLECQM